MARRGDLIHFPETVHDRLSRGLPVMFHSCILSAPQLRTKTLGWLADAIRDKQLFTVREER